MKKLRTDWIEYEKCLIPFGTESCVSPVTEHVQYGNVLTIISMTMAHKENKSCLPVHNVTLLWVLNVQSNLNCIELCCFLGESPSPHKLGTHITFLDIIHHITN